MIKEGGIWYFSTWLTIWCKNFSSASFWAPIGICNFPGVLIGRTKPIRRKRLWAQDLSIFKFSFLDVDITSVRLFQSLLPPKNWQLLDNFLSPWDNFERVMWVDFVIQKTRASSQLIYNDFLGRFLFAMRIFDLSLVTLSKSANCTLMQVWVRFFPFYGRWRRDINTCVFSNHETIFIRVSLVRGTWLFQFLTHRCINSFMVDDSQSWKIRLANRQCF